MANIETQEIGRGLKLIPRDTLRQRIYQELRHALQAGKFEPGESITVSQLQQELGAGAMPIRESLQRLVIEGALINLPNGRVRVPLFTAAEFDEVKEIRLRVEGLAANKAAANMDAETFANISRLHRDLFEALGKHAGRSDMVDRNYRFHFAIYEAARTQHVISIIEGLWLRVSPLLGVPFTTSGKVRGDYFSAQEETHDRLLAALRERDGKSAESAIREMILTSAAWYHRHYAFAG